MAKKHRKMPQDVKDWLKRTRAVRREILIIEGRPADAQPLRIYDERQRKEDPQREDDYQFPEDIG